MDSLPFTNRRTWVTDYNLDLASAQAQFSGNKKKLSNFFSLCSSQISPVIVPENEKHLKVSNSLPPEVTLQVMLIYLIYFLLRKWLGLKCCFVLEIIKHSPLKGIMEFLKLTCIILLLAFPVLDVISSWGNLPKGFSFLLGASYFWSTSFFLNLLSTGSSFCLSQWPLGWKTISFSLFSQDRCWAL